jgi:hypothetical protein
LGRCATANGRKKWARVNRATTLVVVLKVQMWTCGAPCGTRQADFITTLDSLTLAPRNDACVGVATCRAIVMQDVNEIAVPIRIVRDSLNHAILLGVDHLIHTVGQVDSIMALDLIWVKRVSADVPGHG